MQLTNILFVLVVNLFSTTQDGSDSFFVDLDSDGRLDVVSACEGEFVFVTITCHNHNHHTI